MAGDESRSEWTLGSGVIDTHSSGKWMRQERRKRRRFIRIVVILFALTAILSGILWQSVKSKSFPKLAPGMYAGTLRGPTEYGSGSDWLLTISEDFKLIQFFHLGIDGSAHSAQRDSSGYLVISFLNDTMVLKGDGGNTTLAGEFHFLQSERKGSWDLWPVSLSDARLDESFREWLKLRSELAKVENERAIAEKLIPVQKLEIDELTKVINDERALKDRGANRLADLQGKIKALEVELATKRSRMSQVESKFLLAQRVSNRGKLVNLARESTEREARWAHSLLSGGSAEDLEDALQRSQEIRVLREALDHERMLVQELVHKIEKRSATGPDALEVP